MIDARRWLPRRPHGLANANDREGCGRHQVEVPLEVAVHAVLVVERRPEQDSVRQHVRVGQELTPLWLGRRDVTGNIVCNTLKWPGCYRQHGFGHIMLPVTS